jgi:hypothetical protein
MANASMVVNQRLHPRISLKIPVRYRLIEDQEEIKTVRKGQKNVQANQTMDLSLNGLYLVADSIPEVGSVLWLDIDLHQTSHIISAYAEVVWSNRTGGGLHFEVIQEEDLEILKNYLLLTLHAVKPNEGQNET